MYTEKFKNLYKKKEKKCKKIEKKNRKDSVCPTPTLKWHNVPNVPRNTIPEGCCK
jgi:hypothetical protein